jgi:excinuclease ABC subunit C
MVTFLDGRPAREAYRRFRIRNTKGHDDYAMMYEVLSRRLHRHDLHVPDLLMVDGGRGQLAMALSALKDAGMGGVEAVGIAKADEAAPLGRNRRIPAKGEDRIYLAQRKLPVYLSRWPAALFLLQRIRDEAHRFALTYHRRLREAGDLQSLLDRIEGIGPVLRGALLERFGDLARLRAAGVQELMETRGTGRARAEALHGFLQGRTESQVSHTAGEEAST